MKKPSVWFAGALVTTLAGAGLIAHVATGQSVEASIMTVTEPVDVGGTILQPGTYRIKVVPLQENRDMLQVRSVDKSEVFATVLSTNHPRMEKRVKSHFVYYPATAELPMALRTWYPANVGSGGHDIVYPRDRALELARRVQEPVPAYEAAGPVTEELLKTVAVQPVYEERTGAAVAPAPAPPVQVAEKQERRMPRTASQVPLAAGMGLLALVGAAALGRLVHRIV